MAFIPHKKGVFFKEITQLNKILQIDSIKA